MKSSYNIMQYIEATKEGLDDEIQQDIQRTLDYLRENAELNTEHFEEYKFPALDIFHQTLKIKYEVGGDTKELFSRVNQSINFEIVKRDELFRGKRYMKNRILMMIAMILAMPLILLFMGSGVYEQFLETGFIEIGRASCRVR